MELGGEMANHKVRLFNANTFSASLDPSAQGLFQLRKAFNGQS